MVILETKRLFLRDWGQGLATEAAMAIIEYGWQRFQFERVIAVIQPDNAASIRVAEKLGMTRETTFIHQGIEVLRFAKANPRPPTGDGQ